MKKIDFKFSKRQAILFAALIALTGFGAWSANTLSSSESQASVDSLKRVTEHVSSEAATQQPDTVEDVSEDIVVDTNIEKIAPSPTPPATEEPVILSAQEYAEQYLDLSGVGQSCFNKIMERYPDRFSGPETENNIKALRAFASPCAGGILNDTDVLRNWDASNGANGAFFDSDLAKSYHS